MTEDEAKEKGYEVYSVPEVLADESHPHHDEIKDILEKLKSGEIHLS